MTYLIENGGDCLNALFDHSDEGKNDSVNCKICLYKTHISQCRTNNDIVVERQN